MTKSILMATAAVVATLTTTSLSNGVGNYSELQFIYRDRGRYYDNRPGNIIRNCWTNSNDNIKRCS